MIVWLDKVICLVVNLEKYMLLVNIDVFKVSLDYLFKLLVKVRFGFKFIEKVKLLSYIRVREFIVGLFKEFVLDIINISLYFFRVMCVIVVVNV